MAKVKLHGPEISPDVKYEFTQIESGLLAMVAYLELKLKKFYPDMPVFILDTGDASYYIREKFIETTNQEVYQKIPRFVIKINDIQFLTEEDTNQFNKTTFIFNEIPHHGSVRRKAIVLTSETDFISSNFLRALSNFEIMATITSFNNVFTYDFMGNTYEGAIVLTTNSNEKPGMEANSGTRNWSVKNSLDLHLQLLVPRIETIKPLSEVGFDKVGFDINSVSINLEVDKNDI